MTIVTRIGCLFLCLLLAATISSGCNRPPDQAALPPDAKVKNPAAVEKQPLGQDGDVSGGKVGKYQVSVALAGNATLAILCDTQTGQMWAGDPFAQQNIFWQPLPSPVYKPKK